MAIEEKIIKSMKNWRFYRRLPEFLDRVRYLESKLKKEEGEYLKIVETEDYADYTDAIGIKLLKKGAEESAAAPVLRLNCLGEMTYSMEYFKDYKPQRS